MSAKDFINNAGYPSEGKAVSMVRDGSVSGLPHKVGDERNTFELGENVAIIKGNTTNNRVAWKTEKDKGLIEERKMQTMVSGLMHIIKQKTLISVCTPLELTLCAHVKVTKES